MTAPSPFRNARVCPIAALEALVGGTPLLQIRYRLDGRPQRVFAKYESMNMTGSTKDRMALHILRRARERGLLRPNDRIVEASSGNTGISFAALGAALGHAVRIYMPDWMSSERVRLIQGLGAEIRLVSSAEGGFLGSIARAEADAAASDQVFPPRQFENEANAEAHADTTGPEIVAQLARFGVGRPHAFVAGVGTGGTVMGVGRHLRSLWPDARIHPLEPSESPTLRTGSKVGSHRIQGISDEFIPAVVHLDELDEVVDVHDGDAILMAQSLAAELGLAVGISSGANLIGAMQLAAELGPDAVVVTMLPDSNKKYLTTDLYREEPVRDGYWRPRVELDGFAAVRG